MKIRVADYIAGFLARRRLNTLFTIVGGGAMHLNDAFGKHPELTCIYQHNEQACGMSAEGYTRISGKTGVICVTTGPGGMNAISGVMGAWLDSVPMLIISGQVKYETTVRSTGLPLRQMGDQEFDITVCAAAVTKYAVMVCEAAEIRYHLEKALYLAEAGRPGPCWLDIPLDVQGAIIETDDMRAFDPDEFNSKCGQGDGAMSQIGMSRDEKTTKRLARDADFVLQKIKDAKRPVLYVGNGVHIAKAQAPFIRMAETLQIPVAAGFNAHDLMPWHHSLYIGRPGTIGDRAGNFAVQNADVLLIIGCRAGIRQIGYSWDSFAREAYKIMIDIDAAEMQKPSLKIDHAIEADARIFIEKINERLAAEDAEPEKSKTIPVEKGKTTSPEHQREWLNWCIERKEKYPVVLKEYWSRDGQINPYCFMEALGEQMQPGDIVAAANATACICSFQALKIKEGQRIFSNSGSAAMGYDLPAAIGAAAALRENKRKQEEKSRGVIEHNSGTPTNRLPEPQIICLAGDGSIQMNIQELQTIATGGFPIKIFVLNNCGYHSIRQTQANFFGKPLVGCEPPQGIGFPDMQKIADAYGLPYFRADSHGHMRERIRSVLEVKGACLCEVILTPEQPFAPKPSSVRLADGRMVSQPLENMAPFLSREEFLNNMIIAPVEPEE